MSKYDARSLRMRKEQIDLFGDKSTMVVISRPERRALTHRDKVSGVLADAARASPPTLCFDMNCKNEAQSINGLVIFVLPRPDAPLGALVACRECSKKSDAAIIQIVRDETAKELHIDPVTDQNGVVLDEKLTFQTVDGVGLGIVDGIPGQPCEPALLFQKLLEEHKLPRFVFGFRGHNNCFNINDQLYLDFKDLGVADLFAFKEGFCGVIQTNGQPVGLHRWVELDRWAVDAAGGAFGNPIIFQEAGDYYRKRMMTDVRDVLREV